MRLGLFGPRAWLDAFVHIWMHTEAFGSVWTNLGFVGIFCFTLNVSIVGKILHEFRYVFFRYQ